MPDTIFIRILKLCILIEKKAVLLYRTLSDRFEDAQVKAFWNRMFNEESQHVSYWCNLLKLAEKDTIRNVFDRPEQIEKELSNVLRQVETLNSAQPEEMNLKDAFLMAYRAEFYVMHPAFEAMFHLMREHSQIASPEDDYEIHIRGLIDGLKRFCTVDPEMALVAELSDRLWESNQKLAVQLADIQSLRNLIPICMHCKNVRNDQGFWNKVETYLEKHSGMQFSHGICPDCMKKYYPEFNDPTP